MTHFDFDRPSGKWSNDMVPGQADYQRWDVKQAKLINGDDGGTWNPTSPIILGSVPNVGNHSLSTSFFTGGVYTLTGGSVALSGADNTSPVLQVTRSRTITVPVIGSNVHVDLTSIAQIQRENAYLGFASIPPLGFRLLASSAAVHIEIPGRSLHHASRVATFGITFQVSQVPTSVPSLNLVPLAFSFSGVSKPLNPQPVTPWVPSHAYTIGQYVVPTNAHNNGYYFSAQNNASSAGSEPTWTTTVGATVVDGAQSWTCVGRSGQYPIGTTNTNGFYNNGQTQTLAFDMDKLSLGGFSNTIDSQNNKYVVSIANLTPQVLVTGAFVSMDSIGILSHE